MKQLPSAPEILKGSNKIISLEKKLRLKLLELISVDSRMNKNKRISGFGHLMSSIFGENLACKILLLLSTPTIQNTLQ
jgi:hypothetical protein